MKFQLLIKTKIATIRDILSFKTSICCFYLGKNVKMTNEFSSTSRVTKALMSLLTCARLCYTHPNLICWLNLCSIYASHFWVIALKCYLDNVYLNDNHVLVRGLHFPIAISTINRICFSIIDWGFSRPILNTTCIQCRN